MSRVSDDQLKGYKPNGVIREKNLSPSSETVSGFDVLVVVVVQRSDEVMKR